MFSFSRERIRHSFWASHLERMYSKLSGVSFLSFLSRAHDLHPTVSSMFGTYRDELFGLGAGPTKLREQKVGSSLEHGSWTHYWQGGGTHGWYFLCRFAIQPETPLSFTRPIKKILQKVFMMPTPSFPPELI